MDQHFQNTQHGYDQVTEAYASQFFHEQDNKPLDRTLLDRFAASVKGRGRACDIGCGPGQIARYLKDRGADMIGLDLSPEFVKTASRLSPDIPFLQGNMMCMDLEENNLAGITAFYSIIHIPPAQVTTALREFLRVLQPGGLLLMTFHIGTQPIHIEDWFEKKVDLDFYFFEPEEMERYLLDAGFEIEDNIQRFPYKGFEHPSRRCYIFARKPKA